MVGIRVELEVTILEKGIKKTGVFSSQFGSSNSLAQTLVKDLCYLRLSGSVCAHADTTLFVLLI